MVLPADDEPEIVRDYRQRRAMVPVERAFRLTGRVGSGIAIGAVLVVALWAVLVLEGDGAFYGFQPSEIPAKIALFGFQLTLFALAGIFGWACRRMVRGDRRARPVFTIEALASIAGCVAFDYYPELLIVVLPSALLVLLLLWRPRGRRYFSVAYWELVERTPAVTISRDTGRMLATMFLTSLLVIQIANGYWIYRMLKPA